MTRPTPPTRAAALGNPGHRQALAVLPGGSGIHPLGEPFARLGRAGAAAWRVLQAAPWVRETDFAIAQLFCEGLDRRGRLVRALSRSDATVAGSTGQTRANPLLGELLDLEKTLADWSRLLLLDPAQKVQLGIAQTKASTKLDELRSRQAARSGRTVGDA